MAESQAEKLQRLLDEHDDKKARKNVQAAYNLGDPAVLDVETLAQAEQIIDGN